MSVIFNILILISVILIGIWKKDYLIQRFFKSEKPSESTLAKFNNEEQLYDNDELIVNSNDTIKILFLGNSITYTGVPIEDEDKTFRGLASTSKDKDYVHLVTKMLSEHYNCNIRFSCLNIASIERAFDKTIELSDVDKYLSANINMTTPDILVLQMGENISRAAFTNSSDIIEKTMSHILQKYPSSRKIITLPYWKNLTAQNLFTDIAIKNKTRIVDLSHIGEHRINSAHGQMNYSQKGVAEHPGDIGFEAIAKNIFTAIVF